MTLPAWVLGLLTALIAIFGTVALVALLLFGTAALADYVFKATKSMRLVFDFILWRLRRGPHPDLADHIRQAQQALSDERTIRWKLDELRREVAEAIENLRESQPNHICIEYLERGLSQSEPPKRDTEEA